ncbi:MAG: porin family protein [Mangrovibacterium sp.]
MKKGFILCALFLGLSVSGAMAQEETQKVVGGIKLDATTSSLILRDMDGTDSKIGFGATIGGFGEITFTEHFVLRPEVLIHYKSSKLESGNAETDYQYVGVEIPIYAVEKFNMGSGKGFVGIGPYVGLGIDARYKADGSDDVKLYKEYNGNDSAMQRWDFGLGMMVGYEFSSRLQITASYKYGLVDAMNAGKDDASMFPNAISLGLAFAL